MKEDIGRALLIVVGMMMVRVASTELNWCGIGDRLIQAVMATACVYFAIHHESTNQESAT